MTRFAGIALHPVRPPTGPARQRLLLVADLVAQIVGDAAVRIHVVEVLVQMLGQKPGDDREIFVMRMRQPRAILLRLDQRQAHARG